MSDPAPTVRQPVRLAALSDRALRVDEVLAAVAEPAAGGVDLFLGAVRDHDGGRAVTGLEYTAHPSAAEVMRVVAEEVAEEYDVLAVGAVHRVGALRVGETAVVMAAAASHRAEAFAATQALIDRVKARVPIWKHQLFADGGQEWVGTP